MFQKYVDSLILYAAYQKSIDTSVMYNNYTEKLIKFLLCMIFVTIMGPALCIWLSSIYIPSIVGALIVTTLIIWNIEALMFTVVPISGAIIAL